MEKIGQYPGKILLILIRGYRYAVSPMLGQHCRFHPSCSSYTEQALQQHGVVKGLGLGLWRLLRCNPFNKGGYDPVPDAKSSKQRPTKIFIDPNYIDSKGSRL